MNCQEIRARLSIAINPSVCVGQHKVHVKCLFGPSAQGSDKIQPKQQVWDADSVHDVHVVAVNERVDYSDGFSQSQEIRRPK